MSDFFSVNLTLLLLDTIMSHPTPSPAPSTPTPTSVFETHSNLIERAKVCHRNITALSLDIHPDLTTSYEHIPWGEANRLMLLDHIEQAAEMSQDYARWQRGAIDGEEFVAQWQKTNEELQYYLDVWWSDGMISCPEATEFYTEV